MNTNAVVLANAVCDLFYFTLCENMWSFLFYISFNFDELAIMYNV